MDRLQHMLETVGILQEGRALEILDGPVKPIEIPHWR